MNVDEKIYRNTLMNERLNKLSGEERRDVILKLIKISGKSERELARELGVPHTTLFGWKTMKKSDKNGTYTSLTLMLKKLKNLNPSGADYEKLIELKNVIDKLLEMR